MGNPSFAGSIDNVSIKEVQGNPATMTNMVEGNITNQYPLTKIRNYYRMGDGIMDGYPIIQDQTSPNLAHIPTTNEVTYSEDFSQWTANDVTVESGFTSPFGNNDAYKITATSSTGNLSGYSAINTNKHKSIYARTVSGTGTVFLLNRDNVPAALFNLDENWQRFDMQHSGSTNLFYAVDFGGSSTLEEVLIFGAQLEDQSQATAYLKSDGIAAVRKSSTTNLITYSEDFSQSLYGTVRANISLSNILSPSGLNYAYQLEANTTGNNGSWATPTISPAFSGIHTISVFAKKGTESFLQLRIIGVNSGVIFDLNTGVVKSETSAYGNIEIYPNGWYRCSASITASSSSSLLLIVGNENMSNATWSVSSGDNIYLWGLQLEQQTQAETYAKTTGLPVTIDLFTENNYGTMTNMSASDIVEDTP